MNPSNRPWFNNYPTGVAANINPDQYPNVITYLDEIFKKFKDAPAFHNMGKEMTYGQVDKYSRNMAAYFHSRGLKPGDKIAIMMPNLLQYPIAMYGALRAGLILVNTNPLYTPREMKHQFTDSDVSAIIIVENFACNLEKIIQDTDIKTIIVTSIGEMLGTVKGAITNFVVRKVKKMVPKFSLPNVVSFSEALKQGAKFDVQPFETGPDDVILHQYTGGTTGVSKGAMLTNKNLIANFLQIKAWWGDELKDRQEVALNPLPMYHIFAFTVAGLSLLGLGTKVVLVTNARDLASVEKEFKKHKVSLFLGINTLFNALLNRDSFKELDFSNIKVAIGGGMAIQKAVAEKWEQVVGLKLVEGYGMTESSPVASVNPIDGNARIGTIGMPVPNTDMRIVDEEGNVLDVGQVGEIQVKGPQVMKGYFNRQDETNKTIVDGWLLTGDIGMMDEDGYFKIVDRKKDMILVSGFNVYPNEVEDVIIAHPKVLEVAAIGKPDPKSTEVVKVFIVRKDKSLTKEELVAFCRTSLTGYKVPKDIEWRDELPKSNVGKILRRILKDEELAKSKKS